MTEPRNILSFCNPDDAGELTADLTPELSPDLTLRRPGGVAEGGVPDEPAAIRLAQILDANRPSARAQPFAWQDLQAEQSPRPVMIRLGKTSLNETLADAARHGSIVPLDAGVEDTVDVVVDGRVIGQGRVVVVQGKFAVEMLRVAENRLRRSA